MATRSYAQCLDRDHGQPAIGPAMLGHRPCGGDSRLSRSGEKAVGAEQKHFHLVNSGKADVAECGPIIAVPSISAVARTL